MNLCNPKIVKEIMADAGIAFRHDLGQNFLINEEIPNRIADECFDSEEALVLEIGPGIGCLTAKLADRYQDVLAVEIDKGLIPVLARTLNEYENVEIINSDVMKIDIAKEIEKRANGREVCVCANLPYYITTPILMRLLECGYPFRTITVMVQSEVADRLCASAGDDDYGAITVSIAYYGNARRLFTVSSGCFMPQPKVNSAVVRLDLPKEKKYHLKDEKLFFGIVRAAFDMRRKMLKKAINAKYPKYLKEEIAQALASLGINPDIRGECLDVSQFVALSDILSDMKE